jgi:sugar phosphate isomerase/epimerase
LPYSLFSFFQKTQTGILILKRRQFIHAASLVTGAALTLQLQRPLWALSSVPEFKDNIGLQLYTLRNQMAQSKPKTLAAVAQAGYKQVELMDVSDTKELLPICKDLNLQVSSSFLDWQVIANPSGEGLPTVESIIDQAVAANLKHLVFGYIGKGYRETVDQYKQHAAKANEVGEQAKAAGLKLCYHNHSFEFKPLADDQCGFDVLIKEFDPQLVSFELDVFWVAIGGWDPLETLRRLNGRITQVHLKDLLKDSPVNYDESTIPHEAYKELGNGVIDLAEVLKISAEIGVEQCHVEQDQSPDPIASIGQSISHLATL